MASLSGTSVSSADSWVCSLYRNQIKRIPDEIGSLSSLDTLLLSNNCLESVPSSLYSLLSLSVLALDHNRLSVLPPLSCQSASRQGQSGQEKDNLLWTRLQRLDLSYNQLKSLPESFNAHTLPALRELFLNHNYLPSLPFGLLSLIPNLEFFWLQRNPMVAGQLYPEEGIIDEDSEDDNQRQYKHSDFSSTDEDIEMAFGIRVQVASLVCLTAKVCRQVLDDQPAKVKPSSCVSLHVTHMRCGICCP